MEGVGGQCAGFDLSWTMHRLTYPLEARRATDRARSAAKRIPNTHCSQAGMVWLGRYGPMSRSKEPRLVFMPVSRHYRR